MRTATIVASIVMLVAATGASAQILNGSFEPSSPVGSYQILNGGSTAIPGWTTISPGVEWFDPTANPVMGAAVNGSHIVDLARSSTGGGIEQTISTVPGTESSISFSLGTLAAYGRSGTCEILVQADGASQIFTAANPTSVVVWEAKTFTFTADNSQATITFSTTQSDFTHFAFLDGISSATPVATEGSSWGKVKSLFR